MRELSAKPESLDVIRAVLGLGASFGMTTTVEGVETQEQLAQVQAEGCIEVQGFYFSKPRPANEIDEFLSYFQQEARAAA